LYLCLIQFAWCRSSLALCTLHFLPFPRDPSCPHACVNVFECRGDRRSKVSP
jgi:hypothetical protein